MKVGVLLLTHAPLGTALLAVARQILGAVPARVATVEFDHAPCAAETRARAGRCLIEIDQGYGVLVLTDMIGATPSNIAAALGDQGIAYRWIAGVNLPMLLRVINYPDLALQDLCDVAESGAHAGVVSDRARH